MIKTLKSLSYYESKIEIMAEIAVTIDTLKGYFRKFNGAASEEAMSRAYIHACRKYSPESGELKPYIKSLARSVMLTGEKDIPEEEIEGMAIDNSKPVEEVALEGIQFNSIKNKLVSSVLMSDLEAFLKLGYILNNENAISSVFIPKKFKQTCSKVLATTDSGSFIAAIRLLYSNYKDIIMYFLEQAEFTTDKYLKYKEGNVSYIDKKKSRRAVLVGEDNKPITGVLKRNQRLRLKGYTGCKKIYKVYYYELLNQILMKADVYSTNELVLAIGTNRLFRSCSGKIIGVNSDWESLYDVYFYELLTNIVSSSKCRLLTYCYDYVYLLGEDEYVDKEISFKGMVGFGDIQLPLEEVEFEIVK